MTRSDRDHLRTLAICHYVLGGLCIVFGTFPFIHLAIGIAMVNGAMPVNPKGNAPPEEMIGWIFIGVASLIIALYWSIGLMLIQAGSCLRQRKWRTFCLVAAGAACLMQPIGTVLGVFTFIVLLRPSVRAAFEPVAEESSEEPDESRELLPRARRSDPDEHDRYHTE
jgi:hypothetical protein